ncbi:NAD-dependent epimerase/dehydratase family protein [Streptomyces bobili]|uniref:NAD-dependent epimerase/dehydratase family protein n=1 Tax=Streptomyces bobili TaxID=67280 RepID=UPI0037FC75E0
MNTKDRFADLSGATVTVTGGFGLVGSRIVHKLRVVGAKPLAVGRLDAYGSSICSSVFEISPRDPDVIAGDITDAALMDDLLSHSDYVIHAAARHGGTLKRLVFVSSASVYGTGTGSGDVRARFNETDRLVPGSVYANTKLWGKHQTALTLGGYRRLIRDRAVLLRLRRAAGGEGEQP